MSLISVLSAVFLAQAAEGQPAPAFELPDAQGKTHRLADYRGETTVVVFYRGHW